jgi:hypothetical protein
MLCVTAHSHDFDQAIGSELYSNGVVLQVSTLGAGATMRCVVDAVHRSNYEGSTGQEADIALDIDIAAANDHADPFAF